MLPTFLLCFVLGLSVWNWKP